MSSLRVRVSTTCLLLLVFFFNDTATTEIYTLSLHDALPISGIPACRSAHAGYALLEPRPAREQIGRAHVLTPVTRGYLVCRLLLEKKTTALILLLAIRLLKYNLVTTGSSNVT